MPRLEGERSFSSSLGKMLQDYLDSTGSGEGTGRAQMVAGEEQELPLTLNSGQ